MTVQPRRAPSACIADYYVAALPVERLRLLLSPALRAAEPRLARLPRLVVRWMNGVMFYLDRDVPLQHGHAIFIDSEWALTAISQAQFWPDVDLEQRGDGRVEGILSVDVSEWERPGRRTGKVAMACTPEEIRAEVWGQLVDHLDDGSLDEANVLAWFLDPAIQFPNPTGATNLEPLLINTAGSWADRPDAVTRDPEPLPRRGLRPHAHRPRDDGGRQRGGAAGGQRDPRRDGLARAALRGLEAARAAACSRRSGRSTACAGGSGRRPAKPPLRVTARRASSSRPGPVARGLLAVARRVT